MQLCSGNVYEKVEHNLICYEGESCPLCSSIERINQLKKENLKLDTELGELERLIASMKK